MTERELISCEIIKTNFQSIRNKNKILYQPKCCVQNKKKCETSCPKYIGKIENYNCRNIKKVLQLNFSDS